MAIAILISFFGVILLITQNDPLSLLNITVTFGDFWSIAAALSWCGYCFLFPFKPTQITHQSFLSATLAIGACLLIPLMIWELTVYSWDITHVPVWCWIGLLYIILFPSFGSYYFWNQGLTILGSNKGAQFNHLVPLIAVILGIFFLDNSLHPYHISGAICIIFAISLSIYAHKRKI